MIRASTSVTYLEDCTSIGNNADHTFVIKDGVLNEDLVDLWWTQFSNNQQYHHLVKNYCSVIFEALKVGGVTKYVSIPQTLNFSTADLIKFITKLTNTEKPTLSTGRFLSLC